MGIPTIDTTSASRCLLIDASQHLPSYTVSREKEREVPAEVHHTPTGVAPTGGEPWRRHWHIGPTREIVPHDGGVGPKRGTSGKAAAAGVGPTSARDATRPSERDLP